MPILEAKAETIGCINLPISAASFDLSPLVNALAISRNASREETHGADSPESVDTNSEAKIEKPLNPIKINESTSLTFNNLPGAVRKVTKFLSPAGSTGLPRPHRGGKTLSRAAITLSGNLTTSRPSVAPASAQLTP